MTLQDFLPPCLATSFADAFKVSWDFLAKGGLFMIPLILTAFVGMTAILFKWLSLAKKRVIPDDLKRQIERFEELDAGGQAEPMLHRFEQGDSTLARLSQVAVRHRGVRGGVPAGRADNRRIRVRYRPTGAGQADAHAQQVSYWAGICSSNAAVEPAWSTWV